MLHCILRKVFRKNIFQVFQRNLDAGRATVTAGTTVFAKGLLRNVTAILPIAVTPEDYHQLIFYDSGNNDIIYIDDTQIEIRRREFPLFRESS